MKLFLSIFLLFSQLTFLLAQSPLDRNVTLKIENKSFPEAIDIIEKKYSLNFSYESNLLPKTKIVSVSINNGSLEKLISTLLESVELDYKLINNHIVLFKVQPKEILKNSQVRQTPTLRKKESLADTVSNTEEFNTYRDTLSNRRIITVYDTIHTIINDTVIKVVYDTFQITITDTIQILDTLHKRKTRTNRIPFSTRGVGINYSATWPSRCQSHKPCCPF